MIKICRAGRKVKVELLKSTGLAMVIDAHLHVWRPALDFPNPAATTVSPVCDVPIELLQQYMAEHEVDRAVLVQPLFPGEDNS